MTGQAQLANYKLHYITKDVDGASAVFSDTIE